MKNFKDQLEEYRMEILPETAAEFAKLTSLNTEYQIVFEHSADKITLDKSKLSEYLTLGFKYKMVEGFNLCLSKFEELIAAEVEDSNKED